MWLPIASDIAVGVGLGGGNLTFHLVDDERPIHQLNLAIAGQSGTIAAGAKARSAQSPTDSIAARPSRGCQE